MDVFDDFAGFYSPFGTSYTFRGRIVDEEEFDIVPRPSHYERLIRQKQEELEALERNHENEQKYYKIKRDKLMEDKETLLRERDKNKSG